MIKRGISPTSLESWHSCPTKYLYNLFRKRSGSPFASVLERLGPEETLVGEHKGQGSAIHNILQDALPTLREHHRAIHTGGALPTEARTLVLQTIRAAQEKARGVGLGEMYDTYLDQTISAISDLYLGDPNAELLVEHPISVKFGHGISPMTGRLDTAVLHHRGDKKVATIFDHKVGLILAERRAALSAMDISSSKLAMQGSTYMLWALQEHPTADTVEFMATYFNKERKGMEFMGKMSASPGSAEAAALNRELMQIVARENAERQIHYEALIQGGEKGFKRHLMDTLETKSVQCSPRECAMCPMRYHCRNYLALEAKRVDQEIGIHGIPSSSAPQGVTAKIREYVDEQEGRINPRWQNAHPDAMAYYQHFSKDPEDIRRPELWERGEAMKALKGMDSLLDDSPAGRRVAEHLARVTERLPFNLFDDDIHLSWMGDRFRRGLKAVVGERLNAVSSAMDVRAEILEEHVLDRIGSSARLAEQLQTEMLGRASVLARSMNLELNERNLSHLVRRYDKLVDRNLVSFILQKTDEATIDTMMNLDREAVLNAIPYAERLTVPDLRRSLVDLGKLPDMDVEGAFRRIANADTSAGVLSRFRLSPKKFPMGAAAATMFLTYLSGATTISNLRSAKIAKMDQYLRAEREREVDDGTHAAPLSIARRLLQSDFGSAWRPTGTFSSMVGNTVAMATGTMRRGLRSIYQYGTLDRGLRRMDLRLSEDVSKGVAGALDNPVFLMTAAGSLTFITASYLNWATSDRAIGQQTERRKRRLKRFQESDFNQDSKMQEPESALRTSQHLFGPFGSPLIIGALRHLATFKPLAGMAAEKAVALFASGKSLLAEVSSPLRQVLSRTKLMRGSMLTDSLASTQKITRATRDAASELSQADAAGWFLQARTQVREYAGRNLDWAKGFVTRDEIRRILKPSYVGRVINSEAVDVLSTVGGIAPKARSLTAAPARPSVMSSENPPVHYVASDWKKTRLEAPRPTRDIADAVADERGRRLSRLSRSRLRKDALRSSTRPPVYEGQEGSGIHELPGDRLLMRMSPRGGVGAPTLHETEVRPPSYEHVTVRHQRTSSHGVGRSGLEGSSPHAVAPVPDQRRTPPAPAQHASLVEYMRSIMHRHPRRYGDGGVVANPLLYAK